MHVKSGKSTGELPLALSRVIRVARRRSTKHRSQDVPTSPNGSNPGGRFRMQIRLGAGTIGNGDAAFANAITRPSVRDRQGRSSEGDGDASSTSMTSGDLRDFSMNV